VESPGGTRPAVTEFDRALLDHLGYLYRSILGVYGIWMPGGGKGRLRIISVQQVPEKAGCSPAPWISLIHQCCGDMSSNFSFF
jgi:hypothetical protein